MSTHLPPKWFFIEFCLPGLLLLGCLYLVISGKNSEVKSILAMAAGWLFHASVKAAKNGG